MAVHLGAVVCRGLGLWASREALSSPMRHIGDVSPTLSAMFWDDFSSSGSQMFVQFAAATCANDIVQGSVHVPEPDAWLLLGAILVGIVARFVPRRSA